MSANRPEWVLAVQATWRLGASVVLFSLHLAKEYALTGARIPAARAAAIGLANHVVADPLAEEAACEQGRSSIHSTGSSPGFISEALPLALTSIQRRLDSLTISEFADLSKRDSPDLLFNLMGFGQPAEEFDRRRFGYGAISFGPSLRLLADALGMPLNCVESTGEVAVARETIAIAAWTSAQPAGTSSSTATPRSTSTSASRSRSSEWATRPPATPPTAPSTRSPTSARPPPASAPPPTCPRSSPTWADQHKADLPAQRSPESLHPAAPVVLPAVAAGPPQSLAEIVAVQDHRIGPGRPYGPEPVLGGPQQRRADALAPPGGADRQPVQVAAPAIPASDDRTDQLTVLLGHDHRIRIPAEQGRHRLAGIRGPGGVLGRFQPQAQQLADIGDGGSAHYQRHPAILPGDRPPGQPAAPAVHQILKFDISAICGI
jgi:hypothetical protein